VRSHVPVRSIYAAAHTPLISLACGDRYLRRGALLTKADRNVAEGAPEMRRVKSLTALVFVVNHPRGIKDGFVVTAKLH
jgi:GTPase